MPGISSTTGRYITLVEHVIQALGDIIATPVGTRVHRRDYGSRIFYMVDRPASPANLLAMQTEAARAIRLWEPRFRLRVVRAYLSRVDPPRVSFSVSGRITATREEITAVLSADAPLANRPATGSPSISGGINVGDTITAGAGNISDPDGITSSTFAWQWCRDGVDIPGETAQTYTLVAADAGTTIALVTSFRDDRGHPEERPSAGHGPIQA